MSGDFWPDMIAALEMIEANLENMLEEIPAEGVTGQATALRLYGHVGDAVLIAKHIMAVGAAHKERHT